MGGREQDDEIDAHVTILDALTPVEFELSRKGGPTDFTDQAVEAVVALQRGYIEDLTAEAAREARRRRNDQVQSSDVASADRIVRPEAGGARGGAQAVFGTLLGITGSLVVSEFLASHPRMWVLAAAGVGVVITVAGLGWSIQPGRRGRFRAPRPRRKA